LRLLQQLSLGSLNARTPQSSSRRNKRPLLPLSTPSKFRLARQAALEIYDHGFVGNSGSAINNKVARPLGMSVAVAVDGKLVWTEGFGVAELEQCVPVTPKTKFRIGNTSKPLTSAAVALLHDQKRLDLDAPIQRYVPDFSDKGHIITTRQLLGHLGGIRGYTHADEGRRTMAHESRARCAH